MQIYPRYHRNALDYIRCEISNDCNKILAVVEVHAIAELADLVAEFQPSSISVQASFRTSSEYQEVEQLGLPVYSVRG